MPWLSLAFVIPLLGEGEVPKNLPLTQFPPPPVVAEQVRASECYQAWLKARREFVSWQADALDEVMADARRRWQPWYYLHGALAPHHPNRMYTTELYRLLGPSAFFAGHLPPVLPGAD